ncbi:MAG: hypothetical protein ACLP62_09900 [Acidimicrobiales bacterium]
MRSDDGAGALVVVVVAKEEVDEVVVDGATELDVPVLGAGGAVGVVDVALVPLPDLTPLVHPAARAEARTTAPMT